MIFKVEKVKCSFIPNMSLDDKGLARDEVRNKFTRQPDIKTRKHKCIKCWINHYRSIKMMLVLQGRCKPHIRWSSNKCVQHSM